MKIMVTWPWTNNNISSRCSHNMVNFGPLAAGMGLPVWGTTANLDGFRAQRMSTKRCTMFGRLLGWYTLYIFEGSCPRTEFCQVQNSLCIQVLRAPILAALLHGTRAVGVSQTLRRGIFTWQGGHPVRHSAVELSSYCYFARGSGCQVLWWVCLSVCLSVREVISGTTRTIFTKFLCVLPMSVAWSASGMLTILCRFAYRREGSDGSNSAGEV